MTAAATTLAEELRSNAAAIRGSRVQPSDPAFLLDRAADMLLELARILRSKDDALEHHRAILSSLGHVADMSFGDAARNATQEKP